MPPSRQNWVLPTFLRTSGDPMAYIDNRPSWDEYFMRIADVIATRSTCIRRQIGAVIVYEAASLPPAITARLPGSSTAGNAVVCAPSLGSPAARNTNFAAVCMPNRMRSSSLPATAVSQPMAPRSTALPIRVLSAPRCSSAPECAASSIATHIRIRSANLCFRKPASRSNIMKANMPVSGGNADLANRHFLVESLGIHR